MRCGLVRRIGFVVLLLAMPAGCGGAPKKPAASSARDDSSRLPIPADLQEYVSRSRDIGRQLYVLDKASAIATDALLSEDVDVRAEGIVGYIPLQEEDLDGNLLPVFRVTFFTRDDPPRAAYEIRVPLDGQPTVEAFKPPKETSPEFASLARARQNAIAAIPSAEQPINPVLLPGSAIGADGTLVYVLAATSMPGVAVLGKHFLVLVSSDGERIVSLAALSKYALEIPFGGPGRGAPSALMVAHVVTDFPLETHVFTSLLLRLKIYVGTRRGLWRVDGDAIAFLGDEPPGAAK